MRRGGCWIFFMAGKNVAGHDCCAFSPMVKARMEILSKYDIFRTVFYDFTLLMLNLHFKYPLYSKYLKFFDHTDARCSMCAFGS